MPHPIRLRRNDVNYSINVRCQHRYELYRNELTNSFNTIIDLSREANKARLAGALQDIDLFQELANLLDAFVIPGVQSDLARTGRGRLNQPRQKDNLFEWLNPNLFGNYKPTAEQIFQPIPGQNIYFQLGEDHLNGYKLNSQQAYENYAQKYVNNDVQGFFARNPICQHAVQKIAENFTNNLQTFANHLVNDWDHVSNCFFGGNAQALQEIKTTGSDYHKGGKQVLILTFQVNGNGPNKLVYKPSDIEVDCRLVGDIAAVWEFLPGNLQLTHSFAELINRFIPNDNCRLETYKILPKNPGSLLLTNPINQITPIRLSYGYIEYLNHEPGLDSRQGITDEQRLVQANSIPQGEIDDLDWITRDEDDARKFWRTMGKLWAMLTVCGCCDMHVQNFRVHRKKPQVIDLEESFKTRFKTYEDTYLENDVLSQEKDPGSKEPVVDVDNDKTLKVSLNFRMEGESFALNKLVVYKPEQKSFVAKREDYIEDAAKGFIDTMYALRNPNNNQEILTWLSNAGNMIVRYVPIGTPILADEMRGAMALFKGLPVCIQNQVPVTPQNYVDFVIHNPRFPYEKVTDSKLFLAHFKRYVREQYNQRLEHHSNDEDRRWKATPRFAICHPDHNFHDFFNLDVPSYYHRLSDAHLLNSRGMRVIPRDVWNWWQNNIFLPNPNFERPERPKTPSGRHIADGSGSLGANLFTTFFPDSPYNLFRQIFTELRPGGDEETFQQFILDNITELGKGNTREITVEADAYTDYILLADGQARVNYTPQDIESQFSLSNASEFQLPSENEPVLLNGMKVLFDKAASVYRVTLTPKDKIPPKV